MRKMMVTACVLTAVAAMAERQPYGRYESIVDKQMFGPPPVGFDPTKMPSEVAKTSSKAEQQIAQEQEKVKKAIKFTVLNVTAEGQTVVGFSDNSDPKNPLRYYLKEGESQDGWTVKKADRDAASMTIEKDGIEVTLRLGGDSASDANAVSRAGAGGSSAGSANASAGAGRKSSLLGGLPSLRKQRLQREEEDLERRKKEERDRAAREEEAKKRSEALHQELQQTLEVLRLERVVREAEATEKAVKAESGKTEKTETETMTNEAQ